MAAASSPDAERGRLNAERSGHGRFRWPEILTTRAASHTLSRLVMVERTAAAAGTATTSRSMSDLSRSTRL